MDLKFYLSVEDNKIIMASQSVSGGDIIDIEVTEEVYNTYKTDPDTYIYKDDEIIPNPNYEEIKREQERQAKNKEIDSKIKELREMSLIDIMNNNKENIQIYNDVISGLEMSRPLI